MPSINDISGNLTQLGGTLSAGLDTISQEVSVTFTPYVRVVLPLDGYVFWVKATLVNAIAVNGAPTDPDWQAKTLDVQCALHATTDTQQNEDESLDYTDIILTTKEAVRPFHDTSVNLLYVGEWQGIKFAINGRNLRYEQAKLHHYLAGTILPVIETQFIDDATTINLDDVVVSNSLPIWLAMAATPALYPWLTLPDIPFYPAFLLPDNIVPPYVVVSIDPGSVEPIQMAPFIDQQSNRWQLVREKVDLILYGVRSADAMTILDYINQWSVDTDLVGFMRTPVIRDDRRPQAEANVLAQRKTIRLDINYYQTTARDVARQLIVACVPTLSTTSMQGN